MRQSLHSLLRLALLLGPLVVGPAFGAKQSGEDVNYLDLAGVLIKDGHYDRAENALNQVDTSVENLDRGQYHTLRGLVLLHRNQAAAAQKQFLQALATGDPGNTVYVYLAQAHFQQEQYQEALNALEQSEGAGGHLPAVYFMAARSYWELERPAEALAVLERGRGQFLDEAPFVRQKLFYLIKLGLYREAADLGMSYLAGKAAAPEDYIAIGSALRESQQYQQALRFLEMARLRYPDNGKVMKVLAHTYLDTGNVLSAAEIMTAAAYADAALKVEAAELQRRAGNLFRALALNAEVTDQKKKLKQRLAILLALERHDQVAGMAEDLMRVGLIGNEDVRYALAYALFKTGQYGRAEQQLAVIERSDLFRKSVELREAIKQCREEPWQCY